MRRVLWTWNWYGGGWNQCMAHDREEAMSIARKKGAGHLHPVPQSLRRCAQLKIYKEKLDFENFNWEANE